MGRVLVTGGHGFLGREIVGVLRARGDEVADPARAQLDIALPQSWESILPVDSVVHCAAFVPIGRQSPDDLPAMVRASVLGTECALAWAKDHGVKRFVYISSADLYDRATPMPQSGYCEDASVAWSDVSNYYPLGKLLGEQLCRRSREAGELETVSLRLSQVHGRGMRPRGVVAAFAERARKGESLSVHAPERTGDFLYVRDAVQGVVRAIDAGSPGPLYNIGSGKESSLRDLASAVWSAFRSDPPRVELGNQEGTRFVLDIARAQRELNYVPQFSLEQGLKDWAAAMRADATAPPIREQQSE